MKPYYANGTVTLYGAGDCRNLLPGLAAESVDAIVTDPPYELRFQGMEWDATGAAFDAATWRQAGRVLKPGGHLLAFGAPRTYHRMACAIEDAGFELRDSIHWIYGQGMPKSKAQLKPTYEPIVLARKPFRGTVAANIARYGTGALSIDACRVAHGADVDLSAVQRQQHRHDGDKNWRLKPGHEQAMYSPGGRWPTNVVLTHSAPCVEDGPCVGDCPVAELDRQANGASRFFPVFRYEPKASRSEKPRLADGTTHNTVKPLALTRWLTRLVTPPGGVVLDPFLGSGTTAEACVIEGFRCVGIELEAAHLELTKVRLAKPIKPILEAS